MFAILTMDMMNWILSLFESLEEKVVGMNFFYDSMWIVLLLL